MSSALTKIFAAAVAIFICSAPAEAQLTADSPYCRMNPSNLGCPPPVRVQVVPNSQYEYPSSSSDLASQLMRIQRDRRDYELRRAESEAGIKLMEAEAARITDERERARLESAALQQRTDAAIEAAIYKILSAFVARHPALSTETISSMTEWAKTLTLAPTGDAGLYLDALYVLATAPAAAPAASPRAAAGDLPSSEWLGKRKPTPRELRAYAQAGGFSEDYALFSDEALAIWIAKYWDVKATPRSRVGASSLAQPPR